MFMTPEEAKLRDLAEKLTLLYLEKQNLSNINPRDFVSYYNETNKIILKELMATSS